MADKRGFNALDQRIRIFAVGGQARSDTKFEVQRKLSLSKNLFSVTPS